MTTTTVANARPSVKLWFARAGALCYIIWGCLHIEAAYAVYHVGAALPASMAQGRIYQDAWFLLFFAVTAIIVAVTLNWRNSRLGYWLNLAVIALGDTGFIFFVLVPGYYPLWPGLEGPTFWVLGWALSSVALPEARGEM